MVEPGKIFDRLHSEFFAALEACRVQPNEKAVHRLRTSTRRMEALLTTAKRRGNGGAKLARKIDTALKALKPMRRAAGPLRDMDVQRGLLRGLVKAGGVKMPVADRSVFNEEANKVEAKLEKLRRDAAMYLISVIEGAEVKELESISPLQIDISAIKWTSLLKDAVAIERRNAGRLEVRDPDSLHAYRKRSKFSRYLAEMEEGSATAEAFGKRMKKVLDAIGGWHDWMLLTQLTRETVGKSSALAKAVKMERDGALRGAVRAVRRLHRQA